MTDEIATSSAPDSTSSAPDIPISAPVSGDAEIQVRDITQPQSTQSSDALPPTGGFTEKLAGNVSTAALIGADGKLGENWFLALGDEFSTKAKDLGKHKHIRTILQELDYTRKNGVEYPSDSSTENSVSRWNQIANVPESAEGYDLASYLPKGDDLDPGFVDKISQAAYKSHAPPQVVAAIAKAYTEYAAIKLEQFEKEIQQNFAQAQDSLIKDWGSDFEVNASKSRYLTGKLAERAMITDTTQLEEMLAMPDFHRIMLQVGKEVREDSVTHSSGYGDLRSPQDRIESILNGSDPVWGAKWKAGDPDAYNFVGTLRELASQ